MCDTTCSRCGAQRCNCAGSRYDAVMVSLRSDHVALVPADHPTATGYILPDRPSAIHRLADMMKAGTVYFANADGGKIMIEDGDPPRPAQPYNFKGTPCSFNQLRVLLADACDWPDPMPSVTMDDRGIYLRDRLRLVMFTRTIRADGVSVVSADYAEN